MSDQRDEGSADVFDVVFIVLVIAWLVWALLTQ